MTGGRTDVIASCCVYFLKTIDTPWPALDFVTEVHSAVIHLSATENKMAAIDVCVRHFSRGLKTGSTNHEKL
jgi:hypothetical protein